ncbi:MAG: hypothetical protein Kapaf2KO_05070 [Candidatus Kapaibacteriales bacterium]
MRYLFIIIFVFSSLCIYAQNVEHVPLANPVYSYLLRAETKGYMEHGSMAILPLQRKQIIEVLRRIDENRANLTEFEKQSLDLYLEEFDIPRVQDAVLVNSETDSLSLFSMNFFDKDKSIYRYDAEHSVNIDPLASADFRYSMNNLDNTSRNVLLVNAGIRVNGTIDSSLGYFLQITNGTVMSGSRDLALEDVRLRQNVKFNDFNSDFDFTESHIRYEADWFYAYVGRETRQWGPGISHSVVLSQGIPPIDMIMLGARFNSFEYTFSKGGLLSNPIGLTDAGFTSEFIDKYFVHHRASFRPSWGEIALWETIIYSDRNYDIAYLNPLSFLKGLEHALRDRDNSIIGFDATVRPIDDWQVKGSFFLDDLVFELLGTGYWSNKWSWNVAVYNSSIPNIDLGAEYSRAEPYVYSHFQPLNNYTNDQYQIASGAPPNGHQLSLTSNIWWGERYPITLTAGIRQQGLNTMVGDSLVENVGSDPRFAYDFIDPDGFYVDFLDGNLKEDIFLRASIGYEVFRNFSVFGFADYFKSQSDNPLENTSFRIMFRYEDF